MSEPRNAVDSVRSTASTITTRVVEAGVALVVVAVTAVWSLFWLNLARLHNVQGDVVAATITTVVFVGPAVAFLFRYVGASLGIDLPVPWLGTDATDG